MPNFRATKAKPPAASIAARTMSEGICVLMATDYALAVSKRSSGVRVSLGLMDQLAQTLRRLREARGLSLQQVADWLNCKRESVYGWEKQGKLPELAKLQELAYRYETTIDALINGTAGLDRDLPLDPHNQGTPSRNHGYSGNTSKQTVRVRSVIQLMASGAVLEASQSDVVRVVRTDKLKRPGSYYALMVASSANPAFRNGSAVLVSESGDYKMDRLCVVTLADGGLLLLAPLVDHGNAIKFECMDGTTRTIVRADIAKIEAVAAIDADPEEDSA